MFVCIFRCKLEGTNFDVAAKSCQKGSGKRLKGKFDLK